MTIEAWRRLSRAEREAVEAEAASFPLPVSRDKSASAGSTEAGMSEDEIKRRIELGLAEDAEDALAAIEDDELEEFDDWDGEGEGK